MQPAQTLPSRADATTVRPPRPRSARGPWFVLGLLAGLLVAVVARGELPATLHDLREWSARTLRALEHHTDRRPHSEASAMEPVVAQVPTIARPPATHEAPCPIDPGPEDPCAALLAPFMTRATAAIDVPVFPVESLPRVKPPVIARHHHARPAPASLAPPASADDADAKSTTPPAPPKSDDVVLPERIPIVSPEQTAENDAR